MYKVCTKEAGLLFQADSGLILGKGGKAEIMDRDAVKLILQKLLCPADMVRIHMGEEKIVQG